MLRDGGMGGEGRPNGPLPLLLVVDSFDEGRAGMLVGAHQRLEGATLFITTNENDQRERPAADSGRSSTKCMDTIARGGNTSFAFQVLRGLALDRGATTRREGARRSGWRLQHLPRAEEDDKGRRGHVNTTCEARAPWGESLVNQFLLQPYSRRIFQHGSTLSVPVSATAPPRPLVSSHPRTPVQRVQRVQRDQVKRWAFGYYFIYYFFLKK